MDEAQTFSDEELDRMSVQVANYEVDFAKHVATARKFYKRLDELDDRKKVPPKAVQAVMNRVKTWQATVPREMLQKVCREGRYES